MQLVVGPDLWGMGVVEQFRFVGLFQLPQRRV